MSNVSISPSIFPRLQNPPSYPAGLFLLRAYPVILFFLQSPGVPVLPRPFYGGRSQYNMNKNDNDEIGNYEIENDEIEYDELEVMMQQVVEMRKKSN